MIGYIYNTDSNEIICEIHGIDNSDVEAKAADLNYMGEDQYGLTYTRGQMAFSDGHDTQVTAAHEAEHN